MALKMTTVSQIYTIRKRMTDKDLLKIKEIIEDEINRRVSADDKNMTKKL